MTRQVDAIVIGAGQAGPTLAMRLAREGRSTVLIERRHLGGSCVNFGCTPTKAMVASARAAWMARRAAELGVQIDGTIQVDMAAVKAHRDALVEQSRSGLRDGLQSAGVTLIDGHARFVAPREVQVGDRTLAAAQIFINTGARAALPPIPGLADSGYWTPTGVMQADAIPEHLLVLGGGPVGVEYAQIFHRLGSRVTLIERHGRLLEDEDTDVSEAVQHILEDEGIEVEVGAEAQSVQRGAHGITVAIDRGGSRAELAGSQLLIGLGRRPNSDDLGLAEAGIATDARGHIQVDSRLRTNVDGVWALGDVNGHGAFTHTAYNDFEIVANNLFGDGRRSLDDRIAAHAVYLDPPLGRVGLSETQTRASGRAVLIAKLPMTAVARARERAETRGFMKVLVDQETSLILGGAILGIGGDEVVQTLLALMYARAPYPVLRDAVGIHPTVNELLPSLVAGLQPMEAPMERPNASAGRTAAS